MTSLGHRVLRRGRLWAGFRCQEPVVVLESDDWGLRRRPQPEVLAAWGTPSGWADEESETAADLERLATVLAGHHDPDGRSAALTMNVIAANPDHEAIAADGFARYHDRPVDETMAPDVVAGYREGVEGHRFSLQLHGRSHFDVDRWLDDLRQGQPGARALFDAGVDGGLSLLSEESWRYHSEYLAWEDGGARGADELETWLAPAVDTVARLAGAPPRAAVAPHYVLTAEAEDAFGRLGIAFVQATEYRLAPGRPPRTSYLGQPRPSGLVHLTRTVRFDPRPGRRGHGAAEEVTTMQRCFEQGLPAVVDTHRINFTGPWAPEACGQLDDLLAAADAAGARYLTTPELGDAVRSGGAFTDLASGASRSLTPVGSMARAAARVALAPVR